MTTFTANWSYPTQIHFGPGRIAELGDVCKAAGMSKPLLVTDPGIVDLPITKAALAALEKAGLKTAVYSDVRPNPVASNVTAGVDTFRSGSHDGVVAFGGGSALDVGKVIAFMSGQTREMWDFEDIGDWWTRANPDGIAPIIAVPTTSGTGSEVGRAGVITNEETHTKKVIFHPQMMPKAVICDPELTIGLPPAITAGTGMDAFAHCLEAYCAPSYHPMSEGIAVEGMRLVKEHLATAVRDGSNIEARSAMMSAAAMGAVAFQKGLGGIHAVSHPIGALYDAPHGLTNAVVMPYMLRHNRDVIETRIERLAAWLQLPEASFDGFLQFVLDLREEVGIPSGIKALGVTDDSRFDTLAAMSVVDPTASGNPKKLSETDIKSVLRAALDGS